ncbi:2-succinyl-5-enolpyruvyl-6-hydroxy-3-cyclohexene-1-carboxylate synthase [Xanthomonas arboricola]|nr:2-succinyl-5-enolpyruvyl-6-hydroxy-3-cyclohexene-1-carboxylate synthase [Xanthomonas euroxanthea]
MSWGDLAPDGLRLNGLPKVQRADGGDLSGIGPGLVFAEQAQIFVVIDLPAFADRAVWRLRSMQGQIAKRCALAQAFDQRIHVLLAEPIHTSIPQHVEGLSIACGKHQRPQSCARQFFRMKGVLDDLPSQDFLQIDRNALAEGPMTSGGSDEMMRDAHREMYPDLCPAPDLNLSPKSNLSH